MRGRGRTWLWLNPIKLRAHLSVNNDSLQTMRFGVLWDFSWYTLSSCFSLSGFVFFLLCTYQETHFPISNWHSLLHNVSNLLIRYQRWSSCVNAVWIIHTGLSEREREKGHFRNQLTRPLTMNNWSELIKVCRDYPSPPQQIKRHTCVCCLFTQFPRFFFFFISLLSL